VPAPNNVHTATLAAGVQAGSGSYASATVPSGFIWVVTDICMYNSSETPINYLNGFAVDCGDSFPIMSGFYPTVVGGTVYRWRGRQVVATGAHMNFILEDPQWNYRACGYVLTLP
jgi:hypothetical protein